MAKRKWFPGTITDIGMWRQSDIETFSDPVGMKVPIKGPIIESQVTVATPKGSHVIARKDAQTSQGGTEVYVPNESWLYAQLTSIHYETNGAEVAIDIQYTRIHRSAPRLLSKEYDSRVMVGLI